MDSSTVQDRPFFMDFAFKLPTGVEIETGNQSKDCVTWGDRGCDDD